MNSSDQITSYVKGVTDWRGKVLTRVRAVIREAGPDLIEEWKWNTPVWSHNGNVVSVGAFRDHVKINFFKGSSLNDAHGVFNAGLDAKASRAIDIREDSGLNETALKELVRAAIIRNPGKSKINSRG